MAAQQRTMTMKGRQTMTAGSSNAKQMMANGGEENRGMQRQNSQGKSLGNRSAGGQSQGSQLSHKLSMSLKKTLANSSSKQSGTAAAKVHEMLLKQ